MFKLLLVLIGFVTSAQGQCVDINTTTISDVLGYPYDHTCYQHVISHHDCCEQFMFNHHCTDMYSNCQNYRNLTLHNVLDQCHGHQNDIMNISYSDSCHNFTLQLQPYCCDNITQPECLDWYTNCMSHGESVSSNCTAPTKYRNSFCNEYVFHIEPSCCDDYSNTCDSIYYWCLDNHPQHASILDVFVGPVNGYLNTDNLLVVNDIDNVEECSAYCLSNPRCMSFNFLYHHCHINRKVRGDADTEFIMNAHDAVYYEKKLEMPIPNTNCNVKHPKWLGDGFCDRNNGYNTAACLYDSGDCCAETCRSPFCGFLRDNCIDPMVLNPPTSTTTTTLTTTPTTTLTTTPTTTLITSPTTTLTSTPTTTLTSTPTTTTSLTTTPTTTLTTTSMTTTPTTSPTTTSMTTSPSTTASTTETSTLVADKSINNDSNNVMSTSAIVIIVLGVVCALLVGAVAAIVMRTKGQSPNSTPTTPTTQRPSIERIVNTHNNPVYDPHFAGDESSTNYYQDIPSPARTNTSHNQDYLDIHPDDSLTNGNTNL